MIAWLIWFASLSVHAAPSADALISAMEKNVRGTTFTATIDMTVHKPDLERNLSMRLWTKNRDKALVKIKSPAKDKGTANLRLGVDLWQYLPNVEKIIRIPPSLMLQSWMGSNFTNDDLVRLSSLEKDYKHTLVGEEKLDGRKVAKIECLPKPDAPVVWGKVIIWVDMEYAVGLKEEFYTEHGKLVKTLIGSDVKVFGTHRIPSTLVMTAESEDKASTRIHYTQAEFDHELADSLFTQQNMKVP